MSASGVPRPETLRKNFGVEGKREKREREITLFFLLTSLSWLLGDRSCVAKHCGLFGMAGIGNKWGTRKKGENEGLKHEKSGSTLQTPYICLIVWTVQISERWQCRKDTG